MKLSDRFRHLAETAEYKRLAEEWAQFEVTRKLSPGRAAIMVRSGIALRRMIREQIAAHAISHRTADAEISTRAIERATELVLPAVSAFELFIERGMRRPGCTPNAGAQQ